MSEPVYYEHFVGEEGGESELVRKCEWNEALGTFIITTDDHNPDTTICGMEHLVNTQELPFDRLFTIRVDPEWQGVMLFNGSGRAFQLHDKNADLSNLTLSKVERVVLSARLRAWADNIEVGE